MNGMPVRIGWRVYEKSVIGVRDIRDLTVQKNIGKAPTSHGRDPGPTPGGKYSNCFSIQSNNISKQSL